jgi:hypothetical protein
MLSQWDESGNEIVVLAKKMCMMMMDMSDFTRYALYPSGFVWRGSGEGVESETIPDGTWAMCIFAYG